MIDDYTPSDGLMINVMRSNHHGASHVVQSPPGKLGHNKKVDSKLGKKSCLNSIDLALSSVTLEIYTITHNQLHFAHLPCRVLAVLTK